jgi:hypothetical protein
MREDVTLIDCVVTLLDICVIAERHYPGLGRSATSKSSGQNISLASALLYLSSTLPELPAPTVASDRFGLRRRKRNGRGSRVLPPFESSDGGGRVLLECRGEVRNAVHVLRGCPWRPWTKTTLIKLVSCQKS